MKLVITKFWLNSPISWGVSFDLYCTHHMITFMSLTFVELYFVVVFINGLKWINERMNEQSLLHTRQLNALQKVPAEYWHIAWPVVLSFRINLRLDSLFTICSIHLVYMCILWQGRGFPQLLQGFPLPTAACPSSWVWPQRNRCIQTCLERFLRGRTFTRVVITALSSSFCL